jgi:Lrp/AsnC family transcriptional regulator for asnA, asnC and gidA
MEYDRLDRRLVELLTAEPRIAVVEAARRLGVARATVQARLDRLVRTGALSFRPRLCPERFGYPVKALVSIELRQEPDSRTALRGLARIPEVTDIYSSTGASDLVIKVAAQSNDDLRRVLGRVLVVEGISRTNSTILMTTHLEDRDLPLFVEATGGPDR